MKFSGILLSVIAISSVAKINATDNSARENNSHVVNIPNVEQYAQLQRVEPNNLKEALEVALDVIKLIPQYPIALANAIVECAKGTVYAFSILGNDLTTLSKIQNNSIKKFGNCVANGFTSVKMQLTDAYVLENIASCES